MHLVRCKRTDLVISYLTSFYMYIAYIVPSLKNAGPVLVVKELVEKMIKNGHQCIVFYFDNKTELTFLCPTSKLSFFYAIPFDKFDIIHTHGIRPDAYIFFHKPFHCKTKIISTLHNYVFRDFSYQYNKLIAYPCGYLWITLLLSRHDRIVTLSKDAVKYYQNWIKSSRLTWAYNTRSLSLQDELNAEEKKQILDFKQDCILIGANAFLTYRKGLDMLIRALDKLPKYKLFIVGEGKVKLRLAQLARECNVYDRVCFAGYHKKAYRYLSYYDIFAIPSRSEGFPLSLLEASIVGIPTICSDIAVFKELYSVQEVSFFELENIDSLVAAIMHAADSPLYATFLHNKYLREYSPESFFKRYIGIYKSLIPLK